MKDRWATQRLHEYIQKGFAMGAYKNPPVRETASRAGGLL